MPQDKCITGLGKRMKGLRSLTNQPLTVIHECGLQSGCIRAGKKTRTEGIKTEQTPNKNKQRNATLSSPISESSQAKTKETADEV